MAVVSIGVGWVALRALGPIVAEPVSNPYPVIYIAWDSVRADFVSGYGHAHDTTPNLDEFARRAVLFEHTVSPSSWTRPAFTGIMTSVPFWKIGALGSPAGRRYLTLAELLKNRGYRTIGFAQNPNLDARLGFGQGFDEYVHVYRSQEPELMNRLVLPRVEELLSSDRPFFLFVHYQEPHWPYRGDALPNVEAGTFALDDEEVGALMRRDAGWDPEAPNAAEQLDFLHRAYDGDIRAADEALGELLDALRRSELWSQSLIVINSDHGDEFQEHGDFGHAHANLFPEITLVPQVIKFPDALGITPGRVAEFVEAQDIVPTILDVLGIEAPRQIEGRSLVPHDRLDDEPWVARSAFGNLLMLRSGDGAVLLDAGNDAEQQYFDRSVDPQELNPAAWTPDDPSMARISELVAPYAEEWFLRRGAGDDAEVVLDPELQRRLRALGYIR
jgi:arylsulfatase A-like enzyme